MEERIAVLEREAFRLQQRGALQPALRRCEQALVLRRRAFGLDPTALGEPCAHLARLAWRLAQLCLDRRKRRYIDDALHYALLSELLTRPNGCMALHAQRLPLRVYALCNVGVLLHLRGDVAQAVSWLERASRLQQRHQIHLCPNAHLHLCAALAACQRHDDALRHATLAWQRARQLLAAGLQHLDGQSLGMQAVMALFNLGLETAQLGDLDQALRHMGDAMDQALCWLDDEHPVVSAVERETRRLRLLLRREHMERARQRAAQQLANEHDQAAARRQSAEQDHVMDFTPCRPATAPSVQVTAVVSPAASFVRPPQRPASARPANRLASPSPRHVLLRRPASAAPQYPGDQTRCRPASPGQCTPRHRHTSSPTPRRVEASAQILWTLTLDSCCSAKMSQRTRRYRDARRAAAATRIQAWWRSLVARQAYLLLLRDVTLIQRYLRAKRMRAQFLRQRRAALVIQAMWRGVPVLRTYHRHLAAIRGMQRRRRACVERLCFLQLRRSTVACQALVRRWQALRRVQHRHRSILCIQRVYRGHRVRRSLAETARFLVLAQSHRRRARVRSDFLTMRRAAVRLQAHVRMVQQRRRWLCLRHAAITVQTWYRALLRHRRFRNMWLASDILAKWIRVFLARRRRQRALVAFNRLQAFARGRRVRADLARAHAAATVLQRRWRGRRRARDLLALTQQVAGLDVILAERRCQASACVIQRAWRQKRAAVATRRRRTVFLAAVCRVQAFARMLPLRLRWCTAIHAVLVLQSAHRGRVVRRRIAHQRAAATLIQAVFRGHQQRVAYRYQLHCVVVCQSLVHMALARRRFIHQRRCVCRVQACVRRAAQRRRFLALRRAAVTVQRAWRLHTLLRVYHKHARAAVRIQSWWRCRWQQNSFRHHCRAAVRIQSCYRMCRDRAAFRSRYQAAMLMQRVIRGTLVRHRAGVQQHAALRIQTWWRCVRVRAGYLRIRRVLIHAQARVRAAPHRRAYLRVRRAVCVLQAVWRGRCARRRVAQYLRAIVVLQAQCRRRIQQRRYKRVRAGILALQARYRGRKQRCLFLQQRRAATEAARLFRGRRQRRWYRRERRRVVLAQACARRALAQRAAARRRQLLHAVITCQRHRRGVLGRRRACLRRRALIAWSSGPSEVPHCVVPSLLRLAADVLAQHRLPRARARTQSPPRRHCTASVRTRQRGVSLPPVPATMLAAAERDVRLNKLEDQICRLQMAVEHSATPGPRRRRTPAPIEPPSPPPHATRRSAHPLPPPLQLLSPDSPLLPSPVPRPPAVSLQEAQRRLRTFSETGRSPVRRASPVGADAAAVVAVAPVRQASPVSANTIMAAGARDSTPSTPGRHSSAPRRSSVFAPAAAASVSSPPPTLQEPAAGATASQTATAQAAVASLERDAPAPAAVLQQPSPRDEPTQPQLDRRALPATPTSTSSAAPEQRSVPPRPQRVLSLPGGLHTVLEDDLFVLSPSSQGSAPSSPVHDALPSSQGAAPSPTRSALATLLVPRFASLALLALSQLLAQRRFSVHQPVPLAELALWTAWIARHGRECGCRAPYTPQPCHLLGSIAAEIVRARLVARRCRLHLQQQHKQQQGIGVRDDMVSVTSAQSRLSRVSALQQRLDRRSSSVSVSNSSTMHRRVSAPLDMMSLRSTSSRQSRLVVMQQRLAHRAPSHRSLGVNSPASVASLPSVAGSIKSRRSQRSAMLLHHTSSTQQMPEWTTLRRAASIGLLPSRPRGLVLSECTQQISCRCDVHEGMRRLQAVHAALRQGAGHKRRRLRELEGRLSVAPDSPVLQRTWSSNASIRSD